MKTPKQIKSPKKPIVYTALVICAQMLFFILFLYFLSLYAPIIGIIYNIINILIVLYLISKDDNPSFRTIWIIIILSVPMVGGVLYILFGSRRASKQLDLRISEERNRHSRFAAPNKDIAEKIGVKDNRVLGCVNYLQEICRFPVWEDTKSTYFPLGEDMYADMIIELRKAKRFIFMEYFIVAPGIMWDGIEKILLEKAFEGVEIRFMYDDFGSVQSPKNLFDRLIKSGVKVMAFNPVMPILNVAINNRDHRKIVVIDGDTAFTGGINIADEYINKKVRFGHWKDTGIKIKGAAAGNFTQMFLEVWNAFSDDDKKIADYMPNRSLIENKQDTTGDGFILPFSDSPLTDEPISQNVYVDILNQASDYVYIFTPYLVIDDEMRTALQMAAKRGVEVVLITPGIPDKKLVFRVTRANYETLLTSGVKIYEYTPGFVHAKSFVCDDRLAVIGTINLDFRSLYLHFECGMLLYETSTIESIKSDFLKTLKKCNEIKAGTIHQNFLWRLFDSVVRIFSTLM